MNNERVKLLTDALRSGKYKQASGVLRSGDGYCCLGVACDIYRKHARKGKWVKARGGADYEFVIKGRDTELVEGAYLPIPVMRWFGFADEKGTFDGVDLDIKDLTELNDEGESFKKIASVITKHKKYLGRDRV